MKCKLEKKMSEEKEVRARKGEKRRRKGGGGRKKGKRRRTEGKIGRKGEGKGEKTRWNK